MFFSIRNHRFVALTESLPAWLRLARRTKGVTWPILGAILFIAVLLTMLGIFSLALSFARWISYAPYRPIGTFFEQAMSVAGIWLLGAGIVGLILRGLIDKINLVLEEMGHGRHRQYIISPDNYSMTLVSHPSFTKDNGPLSASILEVLRDPRVIGADTMLLEATVDFVDDYNEASSKLLVISLMMEATENPRTKVFLNQCRREVTDQFSELIEEQELLIQQAKRLLDPSEA